MVGRGLTPRSAWLQTRHRLCFSMVRVHACAHAWARVHTHARILSWTRAALAAGALAGCRPLRKWQCGSVGGTGHPRLPPPAAALELSCPAAERFRARPLRRRVDARRGARWSFLGGSPGRVCFILRLPEPFPSPVPAPADGNGIVWITGYRLIHSVAWSQGLYEDSTWFRL